MAPSGERRLVRRLADVAGSVVTALVVFGAVPAVLVTVVGYPLAGGLGHHWSHLARIALSVLALVAWVAWLACCAQLSRAVVQRVRRGQVGLAVGAPLTERLAARIAVGILAVTTLGAPLVVVATSAGATTSVVASAPSPAPSRSGVVVTSAPVGASAIVYAVRPGDSLWMIAEHQLGDGADWTAIAALNLGRTMPDGRHFLDPSLIRPGWDLIMPSEPVEAAVADVSPTPPPAPAHGPSAPSPSPTVTPTPAGTPATSTPATSTPTTSTPTTSTPTTVPLALGPAAPSGRVTGGATTAHSSSTLPELAALGLGAIGCAALARRARRRRLLAQFQLPARWRDRSF